MGPSSFPLGVNISFTPYLPHQRGHKLLFKDCCTPTPSPHPSRPSTVHRYSQCTGCLQIRDAMLADGGKILTCYPPLKLFRASELAEKNQTIQASFIDKVQILPSAKGVHFAIPLASLSTYSDTSEFDKSNPVQSVSRIGRDCYFSLKLSLINPSGNRFSAITNSLSASNLSRLSWYPI